MRGQIFQRVDLIEQKFPRRWVNQTSKDMLIDCCDAFAECIVKGMECTCWNEDRQVSEWLCKNYRVNISAKKIKLHPGDHGIRIIPQAGWRAGIKHYFPGERDDASLPGRPVIRQD